MKYTEEQLDAMSSKVGSVLGERLNYLSRGQEASLEHALVEVFEDHNGQAENISDDEIWGAWMVMEAFYPPDALELSEDRRPRAAIREELMQALITLERLMVPVNVEEEIIEGFEGSSNSVSVPSVVLDVEEIPTYQAVSGR